MATSFRKQQDKIKIIYWYWDAILAEKGIIRGICHSINRYPTGNNKYMKD